MKVLICDHADCMMPDHALEIETLRAGLGEDVEVEVLEGVPVEVRDAVSTILAWAVNVAIDRLEKR